MDTTMLNKLRQHLASISDEQFKAEWDEIEGMNLGGPSVQDFLKSLKIPTTISEVKVIEQFGCETTSLYENTVSEFFLAA